MVDHQQARRVVVGVDSSAGSPAALRWAPARAQLTAVRELSRGER